MNGLTEAQKEILIFLLLAALILLITCIISYCVWKKWCKKEIKREAHSRNQPTASYSDDLENQTFHFPAAAAAVSSYRTDCWDGSNQADNSAFLVTAVPPTAPSLASFRTVSTSDTTTSEIPASRLSTVSEYSYRENRQNLLSNNPGQSDGLPTYEELMIRRDSRINR